MSALSDLQKKLEKESQGIMFPFSANASTVNTTQNVYDSATDGIMTMTGQKYVGPNAVVQYGTEEQGYPRNLKQIEAPMLPQVSNLPPQGTGIIEAGPGTSTPEPISTDPVVEQPAVDPCPPGFKLINGVCRPIEQPKDDRKEPIKVDPRKNIGDVAKGLGIATKALQKAEISSSTKGDISLDIDNGIFWLNFLPFGSAINAFQKSKADKQLKALNDAEGISVTTNPNGTLKLNISEKEGRTSYGQLQTKESLSGNMASTQKLNAAGTAVEKAPNGQNMIVGPLTLSYFGRTNLFAPTTRTPAETDALNAEEKNKLIGDLDSLLKGKATNKPITSKVPPIGGAQDFNQNNVPPIGGAQDFGQLETIDLKDSGTEKVVTTVNKRFTDDITTGHFRLSKTLASIVTLQNRINSGIKDGRDPTPKLLKTAKNVAETEFNKTIQEDRDKGNNNLSKSQRDYLDSNDRKALPGESKSNNGYTAGSNQRNKTKENNGYGFKATSGNYNKSTNTFDQRFK